MSKFNPVMYIFLNKSLGMSTGKASAQVAHAAVMGTLHSSLQIQGIWNKSMHRTIIVLAARDDQHILNIQDYLSERKIESWAVIDEGVNEIDPHVRTALATTILDKDNEDVEKALSSFSLYRDTIRVTMEIDR